MIHCAPDHRGCPLHPKSLNLITSAKPLFPSKVTQSQLPGMRTFGGGGGPLPATNEHGYTHFKGEQMSSDWLGSFPRATQLVKG